MKSRISGLTLWEVRLSESNVSLLITPRRPSDIELALRKARKVLHPNRDKYLGSVATALKNHGTIDA
jgi:hypothetical protein